MSETIKAPRILIADDDPTLRGLLAETLMAYGAEVTAVSNGQEAVCEAILHPYDVCILDIEMPVMNGYEACVRLRESAFTKSLPVLFLTGLNDDDSIKKALATGGWDYVNKPFNPALLWTRISNLLMLSKLVRERDNLDAVLRHARV